jgi:hypothetical protein
MHSIAFNCIQLQSIPITSNHFQSLPTTSSRLPPVAITCLHSPPPAFLRARFQPFAITPSLPSHPPKSFPRKPASSHPPAPENVILQKIFNKTSQSMQTLTTNKSRQSLEHSALQASLQAKQQGALRPGRLGAGGFVACTALLKHHRQACQGHLRLSRGAQKKGIDPLQGLEASADR